MSELKRPIPEYVTRRKSADPALRKFRVAGCLTFALAVLGFFGAIALEISAPGGELTRLVFWTGVGLVVIFLFTVYLSLFRVMKLRGSSVEEVREARRRSTWGGPLGALAALWSLTEGSRPRSS